MEGDDARADARDLSGADARGERPDRPAPTRLVRVVRPAPRSPMSGRALSVDDFNSTPNKTMSKRVLVDDFDERETRPRKVDGAGFAFEQPEKIVSLWGRDDEVLWAP